MSWEVRRSGDVDWVVLDREMCIQNAGEFYQAVLPLAGSGRAVRVDAGATQSMHTSIFQILYALSQAVEDFGVTVASVEFQSAEVRVGYSFVRIEGTRTHQNDGSGAGNVAVPNG